MKLIWRMSGTHLEVEGKVYLEVEGSDGDLFISRKRILFHISKGLNSIFYFVKHFLSTLKISKNYVFFLRTSSEYLTRCGQGPVFKIRFQGLG